MLYNEMGRLAGEAFRMNARIVQNAMLLTVAMNYAWAGSRRHEARRPEDELKVRLKRQARTRPLKSRGKSKAVVVRGLRVS